MKEYNENKIFVKTRYINRMLNVNEILYVESQRRKVDIYTKEEKLLEIEQDQKASIEQITKGKNGNAGAS